MWIKRYSDVGAGEDKERKTEAEVVGYSIRNDLSERDLLRRKRKTELNGCPSYETLMPHEIQKGCGRKGRRKIGIHHPK